MAVAILLHILAPLWLLASYACFDYLFLLSLPRSPTYLPSCLLAIQIFITPITAAHHHTVLKYFTSVY